MPISAYLFGSLRLTDGENPLPAPAPAARSLLAYLLLTHPAPQPRAVLAGTLWPEFEENRARRALTQALYHLRRTTPQLIHTESENISLDPESVWVDVNAYRKILAHDANTHNISSENLNKAVNLYYGELLEGFYDDWVLIERERLREQYLQSLEQLIRQEKSAGRFEPALAFALRLGDADPLQEAVHQEIIRLYMTLNRPEAARRQLGTCARLLRESLGVEPSEETRRLIEEVAAYLPDSRPSSGTPSPALDLHLPLIGRTSERQKLLQVVENAFNGMGSIAFMEGNPGIGKTRLLEELARDAEWRGAQVLWGHARELDTANPYSPLLAALSGGLTPLRSAQLAPLLDPIWLQVLTPVLPLLVDQSPGLLPPPSLGETRQRDRLIDALSDLFIAWTRITPVVLLLEDLHWADVDTINLLIALAPRLENHSLAVISSFRGEEIRQNMQIWEGIQVLDRESRPVRVRLPPLVEVDSLKLIRQSLGGSQLPGSFEARLHQETAGNPLFLLETLRALNEEGILQQDETGGWLIPEGNPQIEAGLPLPPAVERVITNRLSRLPAHVRTVLDTAVVLGNPFEYRMLQASSALDPQSLLAALSDLVQRRLIIEEPAHYRFQHDKIWQVAYQLISEEARRSLHFGIAEAVETIHPNRFALLARHFTNAASWEKAVYYHRKAGERAFEVHAGETAIQHFTGALQAAEKANLPGTDRYRLLASRERVYDLLGRRSDQAVDLREMESLVGDDLKRRTEIFLRKGWVEGHQSNYAKALKHAASALRISKKVGNLEGQAAALLAQGSFTNLQGTPADAPEILKKAISIAHAAEIKSLENEARIMLANVYTGIKQFEEAQIELEKALEVYREQQDSFGISEQLHLLGIIKLEQGDPAAAAEIYKEALPLQQKIGYRYGEARSLLNLGNAYYFQGKLSRFIKCYSQSAEIWKVINHPRGEAQLRVNMGSIINAILGDVETSQRETQKALEYYQRVEDPIGTGHCMTVIGQINFYENKYEEARPQFLQAVKELFEAQDYWMGAQAYRFLILLDIEEGKEKLAFQHIAEVETVLVEKGLAGIATYVNTLKALAFSKFGECERAVDLIREVSSGYVETFENVYLPQFWAFRVLRNCGQTDEARAMLEDSYRNLMRTIDELEPEIREQSKQNVRNHREIIEAWNAQQPKGVVARLPRAEAPLGRPLREEEWVEIRWIPIAPGDDKISSKTARRRHRLLRLLREAEGQGAAPAYHHLAEALGVSQRTIERDMVVLQNEHADLPPTRGKLSG